MGQDLIPRRELALRIAAASEEQLAAATAPLEDFALFAFWTGDSGFYRRRLQPLDSVAVRIAGASQELAEARALARHRLAAFVAGLIRRGYRRGCALMDSALFVARKFLGVLARGIV